MINFETFQVINHGINLPGITDAIDAAAEFFDLPHEEKISLASANVHEPVDKRRHELYPDSVVQLRVSVSKVP